MSAKDGYQGPEYLTEEERAEFRRLHDAYVRHEQPIMVGATGLALRALHLGSRLAAEVADLREQVRTLTAERDAVLERAAQAVEGLPAGTWGDETGERNPWPTAAAAVRRVKPTAPPTAERTPMTVLRAMVDPYVTDLSAKFAAYESAPDDAATFRAYERANAALTELQDAIAAVLGAYRRPVLRDDIERDYEARESGKRPIDAPPLEAETA